MKNAKHLRRRDLTLVDANGKLLDGARHRQKAMKFGTSTSGKAVTVADTALHWVSTVHALGVVT